MIGLLRFVGLLNAAVWVGAAFFFMVGADPAATSQNVKELMGARNYPYFSVAISQILTVHYFHLYLGCSILALCHLAAEWLYLGKYPKRLWLGLVLSLCLYGLIQNEWLQPKLRAWHRTRYAQRPESESAGRAYHLWQEVSATANVLSLIGLTVYLWRVANPSDPARFVSASKFRS